MYVLTQGSVNLISGGGGPVDTRLVEAPAILGESALLHPAMRTNTVLTVEPCRLCSIHRSTFKELVRLVSPSHCGQAKEIIERHHLFGKNHFKARYSLTGEKAIDIVSE